MEGIFKQLTSTVGGMINMAQATISPFKIQQVDFEAFKNSQLVHQNECMYLFKKPGLLECVVVSVGPAKKCYSLFRQTNDMEARVTFEALCKTMVLVGRCCPQHLTEDMLQKLSDCCRDRQTWNALHVAAYVGLHNALEQKDLQGLINSSCPATQMTPLMASVLGKQPQSLELLLRQGASVKQLDKQGNSIYHLALIYCPLVITVAIHIEPYKDRSGETLNKHIKYIVDSYGKHPGFYRKEVRGKHLPVYYVYDSYQIASSQWAQALKPGGRHCLRGTQYDGLFLGLYLGPEDEHKLLSAGFDGFYTYFAANGFTKGSSWSNWKRIAKFAADNNLLFVPSVGPGYVDTRVRPWNAQPTRKRLQGKYFRQSFQAALDAGVRLISVTSFNEWHEGTQVEPAVPKAIEGFKYEDYTPLAPEFYLQLLKEYVGKFSHSQGF